MHSLCFDLDKESAKTKIVPANYPDLVLLIDTGADTPVWCQGKDELLDLFPDAVKIEMQAILHGFGKNPETVDVYRIPEFELSDGTEHIIYENMIVAVSFRPEMDLDFILPASAFRHMIVKIDRLSSVVNPQVEIISEVDRIPMFFRRIQLTENQQRALGLKEKTILKDVYLQVME